MFGFFCIFAAETDTITMKFEELISGRLWAVRGDNADCHELEILLDHWNDVVWLRDFFVKNQDDLKAFYHVNIEDAIWDTIEDSALQKDKARLKKRPAHSSWLRVYAIRLTTGAYIITGGAIKLTLKMEEREHTKHELDKIESVRNFLLNEHIIDDDSFIEYIAEL